MVWADGPAWESAVHHILKSENDMETPAMTHPGTPRGCERIAYAVGFMETSTMSDVYGGGGAIVGLDCHLIRPIDRPSDTLIVFMHPVGGGMYLPMIRGLARAGHHVLYANSRYRGADYALIMEKVAADLEPKFVEVSRAEDTEKGGILQKNGMKLGVVTDEMRAGMVEITKDMKGEMVKEVGGASAEVVSAYEKKIGG